MSTVADRDHHLGAGRGAGASSVGLWWRLLATDAPRATVLIRVVVGGIFVSEGLQKFLDPDQRGPGRFAADTPLPAPGFFAYLTGSFEIVCGALLLIGLLTRLAAIPMIVTMVGAEVFTKVPILVSDGFFTYAHEARAELGQLFGAAFLLVVGAGAWSLDALATGLNGALGPGHDPSRGPGVASATDGTTPERRGHPHDPDGAGGSDPVASPSPHTGQAGPETSPTRLDTPTWPDR